MTWAGRVFRTLLRLFPAEFRREYSGEMTTVFLDQHRRAKGLGMVSLWMSTLSDLASGAFQEHCIMILNELRISLRRLRLNPGFAAIAVLSLALGIGANTAIFSVMHATMLRPLPFRDPDRLAMIWSQRVGGTGWGPVASADFIDWREQSESFEAMALLTSPGKVTLSGAGPFPERVSNQAISAGYFEMLGVQPLAGRFFTAKEAGTRDERVALISEAYWKRRFASDPAVLGRNIVVDGSPAAIIGIVPASYDAGWLTAGADLWLPINLEPGSNWIQRQLPWLISAGRLKQGVSLEKAATEMRGIAARLANAYPDTNRDRSTLVESMATSVSGRWQSALQPLWWAVSFVLLIGCANVANLLLARASVRRRELSLRAALGAERGRLLREMLADSVVLAVPGSLAAIGVALAGMKIFVALAPPIAELERVRLSLPVLGFAACVALASAVAAGVVPAWLASKANVTEALKEGARGSAGGSRARLRSALVVSEIVLATMLLAGAGLMIHTLIRLQRVSLGFDATNVTVLSLDMSGERYARMAPKRDIDMRYVEPPVNRFYSELLEQSAAIPGVQSAAIASGVPMSPGGGQGAFTIMGRPEPAPRDRPHAMLSCVSEGYFDLLRIPILRGRGIAAGDREGSPWVAVISEALAQRYFPGENPLGQFIQLRTTEFEQPRQIVGVAASVRRYSRRREADPEIYMSFPQQPRLIPGNHQGLRLRPQLLLKTANGAEAAEQVRKIAARIDPQLPVFDAAELGDRVSQWGRGDGFIPRLLAVFAGLALLLAAIGIYGLMQQSVADRVHEIGIRMALGAGREQVMRMILRGGMILTAAGTAIGVAATVAMSRLFRQQLYEVTPGDPVTHACVAAVLFAVAMVACYVPAKRAMAVDPVLALRRE